MLRNLTNPYAFLILIGVTIVALPFAGAAAFFHHNPEVGKFLVFGGFAVLFAVLTARRFLGPRISRFAMPAAIVLVAFVGAVLAGGTSLQQTVYRTTGIGFGEYGDRMRFATLLRAMDVGNCLKVQDGVSMMSIAVERCRREFPKPMDRETVAALDAAHDAEDLSEIRRLVAVLEADQAS